MSERSPAEQARAVLDDAGFACARVVAAGHDESVAVITGIPPARLGEVARLAPAIRATGFRYVTLDITEASD